MNRMAQRVRPFSTTIFTEMTNLANEHGAVNLGQGFPDFAAPDFLKEAAVRAIQDEINQYAPGLGRISLREALAGKMERFYGLAPDPAREIVITHGATEAIFAALMGLVNPGDEVVIFEPYYDSYLPSILMAGGVPRSYTLRPPGWHIDPERLGALFSHKTRLVLVNTPHNPIGKVYNASELQLIADLCRHYDALAVVDEVYEHIVFDGRRHIPLAALPGMRERTVTISSLGKSFSVTGWKVGWAIGPADVVQAIFRAHQFITFCGAAPLQEAAVAALHSSDDYYQELTAMYQAKRDFLAAALAEAGLNPLLPQGAYFIMADISGLGFADDIAFCRHLTTQVGVAAIPPSAFYQNPADGAALARFAFCKSEKTLEMAAERLRRL
jgi:N-succinyldiaminopimelate aminotransferase